MPSIKIEVYRDDPWLYLRVIDNGAGIDIERATQILHTGTDGQKHVGLNNVYQRLVFFYGETAKITFSSIPYYENIVQIRIPFIYPIPDFEEEHHSKQNNTNKTFKTELEKLKQMSIEDRIWYIWEYYKLQIFAFFLVIFLLYEAGACIYRNLQDTMLYCVTVNETSLLSSDFLLFKRNLKKKWL